MQNSHCQICTRDIKANTGVIAHHGYQRPGWGEQTSSCYGARELPYEVSRDAIPPVLESYKRQLETQKSRLERMKTDPPATLPHFSHYSRGPLPPFEKPEDFDLQQVLRGGVVFDPYSRELQNVIHQIERNIRDIGREITRLQVRYDSWVPPTS